MAHLKADPGPHCPRGDRHQTLIAESFQGVDRHLARRQAKALWVHFDGEAPVPRVACGEVVMHYRVAIQRKRVNQVAASRAVSALQLGPAAGSGSGRTLALPNAALMGCRRQLRQRPIGAWWVPSRSGKLCYMASDGSASEATHHVEAMSCERWLGLLWPGPC